MEATGLLGTGGGAGLAAGTGGGAGLVAGTGGGAGLAAGTAIVQQCAGSGTGGASLSA